MPLEYKVFNPTTKKGKIFIVPDLTDGTRETARVAKLREMHSFLESGESFVGEGYEMHIIVKTHVPTPMAPTPAPAPTPAAVAPKA